MWKFLLIGGVFASSLLAQSVSPVDIANMREDLRGLAARVSDLSLRVDQLERENNELRGRAAASDKNYVTVQQLNEAIDDLSRTTRAAVAQSKNETLQQVATQMEKLAKQTNAALDSLAKTQSPKTVTQPTFNDDYAKEGVSYTVQKGDTVALIAKKTGAHFQDIINANKLADPSRIVVGQTLFIPNPPAAKAAK